MVDGVKTAIYTIPEAEAYGDKVGLEADIFNPYPPDLSEDSRANRGHGIWWGRFQRCKHAKTFKRCWATAAAWERQESS